MACILINDNKCWVCEEPNRKITIHHAIPQHLKPKNNITIPICTVCHERLNINDIAGLYAYAFKLEKLGTQVRNGASKLLKRVNDHIKTEK